MSNLYHNKSKHNRSKIIHKMYSEKLRGREKYNLFNSLVGLIKSLEGQSLLIDLQNNDQVAGKLDQCDSFLNISLKQVVVIDGLGLQYGFNDFMITKRKIRYIHLPKNLNITLQIQEYMDKLRYNKPIVRQHTFKGVRAKKNHLEALKNIDKMIKDKKKK